MTRLPPQPPTQLSPRVRPIPEPEAPRRRHENGKLAAVRCPRDHQTVTELEDGRWLFTDEDLLNPEKHWDFQESAARSGDAWCLSNETWVPPNAAALAAAAGRTELCRFFPFTAHQYLSFSDGPTPWKSGGGQIAPACISQDPDHGYVVWDGGPRTTLTGTQS